MAFGDGLELANGALAFAEHQNVELMAARGNQRISGVGVIAQVSPDMTVNVASGNVVAGGVVVGVSASATFAGIVAGGNVLFSTLQASLSSGQAVFVFIHVDSSGVITNTDGTPAVAGQQLPPDVPEDELVLAMLTLTQGDTTIDNVDIEDWRVNVPKGGYVAGQHTVTGQLNAQGALVVGGVLTAESVLTAEAVVNLTGLNTTIGEGFLARHTTGGVITYRTFAQVLSDISAQAQDNFLDDLAGLTQTADRIPIMDSATTAALLRFVEGANKLQIGDVLIQWGIAEVISGGEIVITYPIEYTSTPFTVATLESTNTTPTTAFGGGISARSISSFTMQARVIITSGAGVTDVLDGGNVEVYWISIGINTA